MKIPIATPTLIERLMETSAFQYSSAALMAGDPFKWCSQAAERLGELEKDKADLHKLAAELSAENAALKARIRQLEKSQEYADSRGDHS